MRLRSLGDCVLTTPAIEILKASRPDVRVAVVVEDRFRGVFEDNPKVEIMPPSAVAIAKWHPELCINFHGGSRSLVLTAASRAHYRAGFAHFRASAVYNLHIPRAQEILGEERKVHTAEHLASAMFFLGAQRVPIPRALLYAEPRRSGRPYVVLHPFAATPEKTWPPERFLAVAEHVRREHGLEPVFLAGPGEDPSPFSAHKLLSNLSLREVKSLMAGASLFVGNDSGPAHIAAAFGVPVVVLFGPSDHVVWAPWGAHGEALSGGGNIQAISVEQVLRAAGQLRVAR